MADRIKGITVEIGGDTTSLSKALSGVNKEIKSTQTQLKDVNKLLKLDPTNTTLLQQKQQLLKTAISETKDKLTQLKSVQDQMDEGLKNGTASFKCEGAYNTTKYMEQTVTPSNRDSYTFSAQIATENLSLGSNGQVGVEIVIEYEDGSTETRTIDLISSSDTEG